MTILIIISILQSFFIGYQFCKFRYRPKKMMALTKITIDLINEEITPKEALRKLDEIEKTW